MPAGSPVLLPLRAVSLSLVALRLRPVVVSSARRALVPVPQAAALQVRPVPPLALAPEQALVRVPAWASLSASVPCL
jgi:hypothetical protein